VRLEANSPLTFNGKRDIASLRCVYSVLAAPNRIEASTDSSHAYDDPPLHTSVGNYHSGAGRELRPYAYRFPRACPSASRPDHSGDFKG
jgi:hypothetical protein